MNMHKMYEHAYKSAYLENKELVDKLMYGRWTNQKWTNQVPTQVPGYTKYSTVPLVPVRVGECIPKFSIYLLQL